MPYLRYRDYSRTIQDTNLLQILSNDDNIRLDAEVEAEAEVKGYLSPKYDVDSEFLATTVWSPTSTYKGFSLVELNADNYDATKVYTANVSQITFTDGYVYLCNTTTTAGQNPTNTPAKWTKLGLKYALFNAVLPFPEFNYKAYYKKNDQVFWKDRKYKAKVDTPVIDHQTALQYGQITQVPIPNVFPDDPIAGAQYWADQGAYSVAALTLPTNTTYWAPGDNRSAVLVMRTVDVCLYHIHSRIAPRNIPQLRIDRYKMAIDYLMDILKGSISADIPLIQPKIDGMIRFSSDVKRDNSY